MELPTNCCNCRLITKECYEKIIGIKDILSEKLEVAFNLAHNNEITEFFGEDCYDALCNYIAQDYPNSDYDALLERAQKFMAYTIHVYYLKNLYTGSVDNTGITQSETDTKKVVSETKFQSKVEQFERAANLERVRLKKWIVDNEDAYSCFECLCSCDNNLLLNIIAVE